MRFPVKDELLALEYYFIDYHIKSAPRNVEYLLNDFRHVIEV